MQIFKLSYISIQTTSFIDLLNKKYMAFSNVYTLSWLIFQLIIVPLICCAIILPTDKDTAITLFQHKIMRRNNLKICVQQHSYEQVHIKPKVASELDMHFLPWIIKFTKNI